MHKNGFSCFIHNSPKLETTKCLSTKEWVSKLHIMEYYTALGPTEPLFNISMIPYIWNSKNVKLIYLDRGQNNDYLCGYLRV